MHKLRLLTILGLALGLMASASADTLKTSGISAGEDGSRPLRGTTQAQVEAKYGSQEGSGRRSADLSLGIPGLHGVFRIRPRRSRRPQTLNEFFLRELQRPGTARAFSFTPERSPLGTGPTRDCFLA